MKHHTTQCGMSGMVDATQFVAGERLAQRLYDTHMGEPYWRDVDTMHPDFAAGVRQRWEQLTH